MRTSSAWHMPSMPSLIARRYWMSESMKACGSNGAPSRSPNRAGMTSCGCVCTTWYISTNASMASFQFTGRRHAYHFSARIDSTFHASSVDAAGSRHSRTGGASSVEVDPRAPAPHLAPHRHEVEILLHQVVLGERPPLRDRGVRAVGPVAPTVERAPEPTRARPAALDEPSRRGGGTCSGTP